MQQNSQGSNRRELLKQAAALAGMKAIASSRMLGATGALGTAFIPQRGHAYVAQALAIASTICGFIGSRKKGDGGIGAMLTASIEYQRVMAQQLQDLQLGMAEVLLKVNALPAEIRAALHESRMKSLHAEIGGSIDQYHNEVSAAAASYPNYQAWAQNPLARSRMANISTRIDVAISNLSYGGWTDAVTSLYLPPALFASLGAMALLGESNERLKAEAQRYLDLMQRALDPAQPGSIGAALQARESSFKSIALSLQQLGVNLPPVEQTKPMEVVLGEQAIQHYIPAVAEVTKCRRERRGGGGRGGSEYGSADDTICTVTTPAAAEVVGSLNGFSFKLTVHPLMVTDPKSPGNAFGIRQFIPANLEVVNGASASAPVSRIRAPGADTQLAAAKSSSAWQEAENKATRIRAFITALNQDMAFLALNAGATASLQAARSDVFAFFGGEA